MKSSSKIPTIVGKSSLVRPRYSPGLMLQDDDLTQAVDYTRALNRLLFKTLFGCGVLCGFRVHLKEECGKRIVQVDEGVAMDCHGDPIHVPDGQRLPLDDSCGMEVPDEFWIIIRRNEHCCAPRDVACSPEDDDTAAVCTRVRDGFEIRLVKDQPQTACGCIRKDVQRDEAVSAGNGSEERVQIGGIEQHMVSPTRETPPIYADPNDPCYAAHYCGECVCGCDSDWVVLARVYVDQGSSSKTSSGRWEVDYSVRRFIRPVLMRDPLREPQRDACVKPEQTP